MLWRELLSIWATVFAVPFAGAAQPLALPLPQTTDYATYMRGQLLASTFSTDPQERTSHVAAAQGDVQLEAFIINYEPCAQAKDVIAYRLVVRNVSQEVINGVVAQFHYPDQAFQFKEATATPVAAVAPSGGGLIEWNIGTLLPGHENWQELNITFIAVAPTSGLTTELTVSGGSGFVLTSHTIPDNCFPVPLASPTPLNKKTPAIVCDPGELGCTPNLPLLGPLFDQATQDPARRPIVCSPNDPDGCISNKPLLGVRFAEAVASLLPGECSSVEDAVLADPEFQDGLNRRADVAAFFMRPLYDSGQDFSRLVLENELLGIKNMLSAKDILRAIHTKHWDLRIEPLESVLNGTLTTDDIRARINQWYLDWIAETRAAQVDLQAKYEIMQHEREQKFVPVAEQAISNAITALERACGEPPLPPNEDAGLRKLLLTNPGNVQLLYIQSLGERTQAYPATQALFVDPNNSIFPEANRATTWQAELRAALDAFDAGNRQPLELFIASIPKKDQEGFAVGWELTYQKHAVDDVAADENIRLSQWEIALDTPKKAAAECARDTTMAARIEISWCESGLYPTDYILPAARDFPTVRDTAPPDTIAGGEAAVIDINRTLGKSCGRLPGDPFWAADCSCSCDQIIPDMRDPNVPNLRFCQAGQELQAPPTIPELPPPPPPPATRPTDFPTATPLPTRELPGFGSQFFAGPVPTSTLPPEETPSATPGNSSAKPIIRHDIYAIAQAPRTQDECLNELPLDDHFLVNYP